MHYILYYILLITEPSFIIIFFLHFLTIWTVHISLLQVLLLPAIKHLERTFQATSIIDDSKNVSAQFSGHLFIFSIRTFPDRQSPINFR